MNEQKSIKKNAFYSFLKAFFRLAFPLISFPYASRILHVEGIGKINFANSVTYFFTLVAMLGIDTYATREAAKVRDDKGALSKFVKEILLINTVSMLASYAILMAAIFLVPKFSSYRAILLVFSIQLLFNTMGMEWLYQALEEFRYITVRTFLFQCLGIAFLFIFVRDESDLIFYAIFVLITTVGSGFCNMLHSGHFIDYRTRQRLEIKKHIGFVFMFFGMSMITSLYHTLDTVMIGLLSNDTQTGIYTASTKLNTIIVGLLTALSATLLPRLSYYKKNNSEESFRELAQKGLSLMCMIAIPMTFAVIALTEPMIRIICGEAYLVAIRPMHIISPIIFAMAISNIIGVHLLPALDKERISLISYAVAAGMNITINALLIPKYGAEGAAIGTLIAEFSVLIFQAFFVRKFIFTRNSLLNSLEYLISSAAMFYLIHLITSAVSAPVLQLIFSFMAGVLAYSALLFIFRNKVFLGLARSLTDRLKKS